MMRIKHIGKGWFNSGPFAVTVCCVEKAHKDDVDFEEAMALYFDSRAYDYEVTILGADSVRGAISIAERLSGMKYVSAHMIEGVQVHVSQSAR